MCVWYYRIVGGELFEDIVRRAHYSEADARLELITVSNYITKYSN